MSKNQNKISRRDAGKLGILGLKAKGILSSTGRTTPQIEAICKELSDCITDIANSMFVNYGNGYWFNAYTEEDREIMRGAGEIQTELLCNIMKTRGLPQKDLELNIMKLRNGSFFQAH